MRKKLAHGLQEIRRIERGKSENEMVEENASTAEKNARE